MKKLFYIFGLLIIASCVSRQKKANQYFDSNRGELAEKCQEEFPADTIKIIQGVEVVKYDTIKLPGVVIECPQPENPGDPVYVKCPESKTITVVKERTDTIVITDTQKTKALEHQLKTSTESLNAITIKYNTAQSQFESERTAKRTYLWALIVLAVFITGYIGVKVIK